jgi:hypothetical protein
MARDLPPRHFVTELLCKMWEMNDRLRRNAESHDHFLVPYILEHCQTVRDNLVLHPQTVTITDTVNLAGLVRPATVTGARAPTYSVGLRGGIHGPVCGCGEWKLMGAPCGHANALAGFTGHHLQHPSYFHETAYTSRWQALHREPSMVGRIPTDEEIDTRALSASVRVVRSKLVTDAVKPLSKKRLLSQGEMGSGSSGISTSQAKKGTKTPCALCKKLLSSFTAHSSLTCLKNRTRDAAAAAKEGDRLVLTIPRLTLPVFVDLDELTVASVAPMEAPQMEQFVCPPQPDSVVDEDEEETPVNPDPVDPAPVDHAPVDHAPVVVVINQAAGVVTVPLAAGLKGAATTRGKALQAKAAIERAKVLKMIKADKEYRFCVIEQDPGEWLFSKSWIQGGQKYFATAADHESSYTRWFNQLDARADAIRAQNGEDFMTNTWDLYGDNENMADIVWGVTHERLMWR